MRGLAIFNLSSPRSRARFAKTDARYWLSRIRKPVNSRGEASPHWHLQLTFKGRRLSFSLHTGNKEAAARQATDIYKELATLGVDVTLTKHRPPEEEPPPEIATIGFWIETVQKMFAGNPATFGSYARCLRLIVGDILQTAKSKKRFSRVKGNAYRDAVNSASLEVLTPKAIQEWRIRFVAKVRTNPAAQRSAKISCNSILRQAGALFSKKLVKFVSGITLPSPVPFTDCEKYPRESMRYHSKIDVTALLQKAEADLSVTDPEAFKVLLLGVGLGLRRGEIDKLLWRQFDLNSGTVRVETTEAGSLKSADSEGDVQFDETLCAIFRGYRALAKGDFFVEREGGESGVHHWGRQYRCNAIFKRTLLWLRANGVDVKKPIHTLRKEAGSIITSKSGIHAASRFLRHSDMHVTAMHYADEKKPVMTGIGQMLEPKNITPIASHHGALEAVIGPTNRINVSA